MLHLQESNNIRWR